MTDSILTSRQGSVAVLTLSRPEALNAFDLPMIEHLANNLITLAADPAVRGVVLAAEGRAFCAGGDLKWAGSYPGGHPAAFHELAARFHAAILEIRRMPKPVIAAVQGVAAGGGFSLALACDFRVMAESATFLQAYTAYGLCIDGGGTFSLPRIIGLARALEVVAFNRPVSARQALDWGLVTKVVPDGSALGEAVQMAEQIAGGSLSAFGMCKQLLNDSFDTAFEAQLEKERHGISTCASHPDGQEGLKAFSERRKPDFQGAR